MNRLKLGVERRKVALRAQVLSSRVKIANEQDRLKRAREELRSMSGKSSSKSTGSGIPVVRLAGGGR